LLGLGFLHFGQYYKEHPLLELSADVFGIDKWRQREGARLFAERTVRDERPESLVKKAFRLFCNWPFGVGAIAVPVFMIVSSLVGELLRSGGQIVRHLKVDGAGAELFPLCIHVIEKDVFTLPY
jgi:hypothetical protein